jgi:hypothetical protein
MPLTIHLNGQIIPAAQCPRCGAKVFPESLLEGHLLEHDKTDRWFSSAQKSLRKKIRSNGRGSQR